MYLDFGVKEMPSNAIHALSGDSCEGRNCACPAIPCTPYSCGTEGYYGAGDECCPPCCPCSNFDPPDDGNPLPQSDPNNSQSDPTIPEVCDMLVLCADGTSQQACFQTFEPLCTGHGGEYDPDVVYEPESDDPCEGVRCIRVYKPCPEGYLEASECCPNTGNCVPDPNYIPVNDRRYPPINHIAYDGVPDNAVGFEIYPPSQFDQTTPIAIAQQDYITQFDQAVQSGVVSGAVSLTSPESQYTLLPINSLTPTRGGAGGLVGAVDETMLRSNTTTPTTTTATSTPEEPEESGLGILALGLIALEVLAT